MSWSPLLLDPRQLKDWEGLIVDARTVLRYAAGHIPKAISLPMDSIRHQQGLAMLVLEAESFAQVVGQAGVDTDTPIVLYGERGQPDAGYLYWALSYYGHSHLHLLDGGIEAWQHAGYSLTTDGFAVVRSTFVPNIQQTHRVQTSWLLDHHENPDICLLDNRSDWEYTGEETLTLQSGHIPGANWLPWDALLQSDLRLKPKNQLKTAFQSVNLCPKHAAVVYCQTGNRSGLVYVALQLIDHADVRMYDASWSHWGNDLSLPVEGGGL